MTGGQRHPARGSLQQAAQASVRLPGLLAALPPDNPAEAAPPRLQASANNTARTPTRTRNLPGKSHPHYQACYFENGCSK